MLSRGHPTIVDAIEKGKTLFRDEEYERLLNRYKEMKKRGKLRRASTTITF